MGTSSKYARLKTKGEPKKYSPVFVILMCGISVVFLVLVLAVTFQPRFLANIKTTEHGTSHGKVSMLFGRYNKNTDSCAVEYDGRFDCLPEGEVSQQNCANRECCWNPVTSPNVPWCFYSTDYGGYQVVNKTNTDNGLLLYWRRTFPSSYIKDVRLLKVYVNFETDYRIHVKIVDAEHDRYESLYPVEDVRSPLISSPMYKFISNKDQAGFKIIRNTGEMIFDSLGKGGFIYSDQFLQMSAGFIGKVYGLGEHRSSLMLDTHWNKLTLFNHDSIPQENKNLYGSHPFLVVLEPGGKSHGVFLRNSNAMDIILQPLPAVTFRTIGGIFDFYFLLGPTPSDVVSQYCQLVGYPFMPPYWSLGFHLSRFGYNNLTNMKDTWRRNRNAEIPFDTQWNDIDYMVRNNDFTLDTKRFRDLPQFVNQLHDLNMHWIPMIDPGISGSEVPGTYPPYELGLAMDVFIKDWNNLPFNGKVWNSNSTVFPDFTHPNATKYWTFLLQKFYRVLPFDGLWIDMNEPSNFLDGTTSGCPDNELEHPQYVPAVDGGKLAYKTVCMSAKHHSGLHYNLHNLYGISEADVTHRSVAAVTAKRPFIISRSTFSGHGYYCGHWSGDVVSEWYDMKKTIPELLSFSLFGVPMMGADICGFNGNTTVALCNRWSQLGAFYPFSRNHNTDDGIDQDPAALGEPVVTSAKRALRVRYTLLPYLYTLFWRAHMRGTTVARPLFFEFPQDSNTHNLDESFLWGSAVLIVPVLEENATSVNTYLPDSRWYDWYTYTQVPEHGVFVNISAPVDTIPVFIRGGSVLPLQQPSVTITESRLNGFTILGAFDFDQAGWGELYWDDGQTIGSYENGDYSHVEYTLSSNNLTNNVIKWNVEHVPDITTITLIGCSFKDISVVTLNQVRVDYKLDNNVMVVDGLKLALNDTLILSWS